jgi:hypothetical protein
MRGLPAGFGSRANLYPLWGRWRRSLSVDERHTVGSMEGGEFEDFVGVQWGSIAGVAVPTVAQLEPGPVEPPVHIALGQRAALLAAEAVTEALQIDSDTNARLRRMGHGRFPTRNTLGRRV